MGFREGETQGCGSSSSDRPQGTHFKEDNMQGKTVYELYLVLAGNTSTRTWIGTYKTLAGAKRAGKARAGYGRVFRIEERTV